MMYTRLYFVSFLEESDASFLAHRFSLFLFCVPLGTCQGVSGYAVVSGRVMRLYEATKGCSCLRKIYYW